MKNKHQFFARVDDNGKNDNDKASKIDVTGLAKRLFNPYEPYWVLVPNGSIAGAFDFVPEYIRVGPWNRMVPFFMIGVIGILAYIKPTSLIGDLEVVNPELYSYWWFYNLILGAWMLGSLIFWLKDKPFIIFAYTIQSWLYITLRHCLTALAPFLSETHFLLKLNELLRFQALLSATITFTLWNFAIGPAIYFLVKTPEKRQSFIDFCFSFKLIQMHVFNLFYAVWNTVSISPRRLFTFRDLWFAMCLACMYMCFYFLVLDRLGLHLYPIFSPRFKYTPVVICLSLMSIYGLFNIWNKTIERGTFSIEE